MHIVHHKNQNAINTSRQLFATAAANTQLRHDKPHPEHVDLDQVDFVIKRALNVKQQHNSNLTLDTLFDLHLDVSIVKSKTSKYKP